MEDSKAYFLQAGYIFASQEPHLIHIVLGSCVAVCLWDSQLKFGGACHYIYPVSNKRESNGKLGEVAIPHLTRLMQEMGSEMGHLKAHIIGGGVQSNSNSVLGRDNVAIADNVLEKYGIKIVTREVGGSFGRKVVYNSLTGKLFIYQTDDIRQSDWYEL